MSTRDTYEDPVNLILSRMLRRIPHEIRDQRTHPVPGYLSPEVRVLHLGYPRWCIVLAILPRRKVRSVSRMRKYFELVRMRVTVRISRLKSEI